MGKTTFPNIPNLDAFLSTLSILPPTDKSNYVSEIISQSIETFEKDKFGQTKRGNSPNIKIWYKTTEDFDLDRLAKIVTANLHKIGHLSDKQIVLSVLGLYALYRPSKSNATEFLFEVLNHVHKTSVEFFYIFPKLQPIGNVSLNPFKFGSYSFGKINLGQVRRLCKAVGSDYFERYENFLRDRFMIMRIFTDITVINWFTYKEMEKIEIGFIPAIRQIHNELVESYFANLHQALSNIFLYDMAEQQEILLALKDAYLDERVLKMVPDIQTLAIFENVVDNNINGYVSTQRKGEMILGIPGIDRTIPAALNLLKSEYNFIDYQDVPIHRTIKSFVSFIARAKRHWNNEHVDEAFLHFVIALDLVFGEADKLTESVSSRVAAITYRKFSANYSSQQKTIKDIYSKRSKYVHEGEPIKQEALTEVEKICLEVLTCMLRLQKDEKRRSIDICQWLKDLDLISATLDACKVPQDNFLIECGIEI